MNPMMMELLPLVHQGYCCSQLLLLLMLQAQDRQNPGVVRAAQGLCHGIGQSDGPCGLLTGGACALALVAGKGAEDEIPHPMLTPLLNDYATWFYDRTEAYGGQRCGQIAAGLGATSSAAGEQPNPVACGDLLAECWGKIMELVQSYELDLTEKA
ncbi:DVU_1555 family C-GCAxxG-C-C protein [Desulfovibrio desulfuricans]|uniref:DVU_1555 family C-GCAxxG-C-C protein n=1 Tax=Desulfovibrio desulfuricans TaxID=876 RepID=UPI003983E466